MKVHDSLPTEDLVDKPSIRVKALKDMKYGVFFLPENLDKTLEVVVLPIGTKGTADFRCSDTAFRTQLGAYVRPKGPIAARYPELAGLKVSVRKSKSKAHTFYVTVVRQEAQ